MEIQQNLIITFSNQRANDLKGKEFGIFDRIVSLDSFISDIFSKIGFEKVLESFVAKDLIYNIIKTCHIDYFDYLSIDGNGLDTIRDFIVLLDRNELESDKLISGQKLEAIKEIAKHYKEYKQKHNLVDISDIEKKVLEYIKTTNLKDEFTQIYIDDFYFDGLCFFKSKLQKDLIDYLLNFALPLKSKKLQNIAALYKPSKKPFDTKDEVITALKISRKLLEENKDLKPSDICIVATAISDYAPLFRLYKKDFGLKGYDSIGIPLVLFQNKKQKLPLVEHSFLRANEEINRILSQAKTLGLDMDKQSVQNYIYKNRFFQDEKEGILLTEANNLLGSNKIYEHIILIGADINNFPPKASDNFLYSSSIANEYFFQNDYYTSSKVQYEYLKKISKNLYIMHASQKNKKPLLESIIVDNNISNTIDVSDIFPIQTSIVQEEYISSLLSNYMTKYDGLDVDGITSDRLSASQLGSYAKCPMKYLYTYKLEVQAPRQDKIGLDASQEGTLMHSCFEEFAKKVQGKRDLDTDTLKSVMIEVLDEEYKKFLTQNEIEENIYHILFKNKLLAGLKPIENAKSGLLSKFVDYYTEKQEELEFFEKSQFEKEFALDENFEPYEISGEEDKGYFIKGFIDRIDVLKDVVNIIDYKSKKANNIDKNKLEEIATFLDFQLALYVLYAKKAYGTKDIKASLLSFKTDRDYIEFANVSTNTELILDSRDKPIGVLYNDEFENDLKANIKRIKEQITNGDFRFDNTNEDYCGYCELSLMFNCRVLSKGF